jgi:hypothetical protein
MLRADSLISKALGSQVTEEKTVNASKTDTLRATGGMEDRARTTR